MIWLLAILGVVIIAALGTYAWRLQQQVKTMEAAQAAALEKKQQQEKEKHDYVVTSIRVIAHNAVHEDLNLSETCIRLKVLLDNVPLSDAQKQDFEVFNTMFEEVQNFDTHEARKKLPKNERMRQDLDRQAVERRYREQILSLCDRLLKEPL